MVQGAGSREKNNLRELAELAAKKAEKQKSRKAEIQIIDLYINCHGL